MVLNLQHGMSKHSADFSLSIAAARCTLLPWPEWPSSDAHQECASHVAYWLLNSEGLRVLYRCLFRARRTLIQKLCVAAWAKQ